MNEDAGDAPDDRDGSPPLAGMDVDDAVEAVVSADQGREREGARETLSYVSEGGVVTEAAVEDATARVSKAVATPETRVELAEIALETAREDAAPVRDLAVVAARLDDYAVELDRLRDRLEAVQAALRDLVDRADDPDSLYGFGRECRDVTERANALQQAADDLKFELEAEFDQWLSNPATRATHLVGDVDAVEAMCDELTGIAEALDDADEGETPTLPGGETVADPAVVWFDAALRVRLAGLLLADLRAELADLRTWADREAEERPDDAAGAGAKADDPGGTDADALVDVESRLDSLDVRTSGLEDWLAALAKPAWRRRFGDRVATFEHAVSDRRPPVDWSAVQATLEDHRSAALDAD
ncbi:MAG: hypothetical protein V5A44_03000 [Haloarculaceae archaeon]